MKKIILAVPVILLASFLGASNVVSSPTMEEVLGQLKLKDQNIQRLQFQFEQNVTFVNSSLNSKTMGEAIFEKPGKLNVHQKSPQEQLTVTDGKKTWVYTPSYKQVWVGSGKKDLVSLLPKGIIPLHNLAEDLEKNYVLTLVSPASSENVVKEVRLRAEPKVASDFHLEFVISTETWLPMETTYISSSAKVVTRLSSIQLNPVLPGHPFQFVPPPGTDVIPF